MKDQAAYQRARKRVEAKIGFFTHLAVYVSVNFLLIIINLARSQDSLWFFWPLLGWGIGILFHGLGVYVFSGTSSIIEKMILKEMKKKTPGEM